MENSNQLSDRQQLIAETFNIATLAKRLQNGLTIPQLFEMVKAAHPFVSWSSPASSEVRAIATDTEIVCGYLQIEAAVNLVTFSFCVEAVNKEGDLKNVYLKRFANIEKSVQILREIDETLKVSFDTFWVSKEFPITPLQCQILAEKHFVFLNELGEKPYLKIQRN